MSPPRSRRHSRQEAEPRRPKSRQEFSPSSRWDSGREAKSRRPKSRRDPGGNPAKIPPGFTAGSENSAAKISAGDPASALGAKRNPGGQNLGRIPAVIPPRSRRDSRRGTEIPEAKIAAGPGGNPGGIPPGFTAGNGNPGGQNLGRTRRESRWDPAKIPPRSRWLFYKGVGTFSITLRKFYGDFTRTIRTIFAVVLQGPYYSCQVAITSR